MSFRSTTSATAFTNRGFRVLVDRQASKLRFIFDASKADISDPGIREWLERVREKAGLGPIDPEPYWGFEDLRYAIGSKIRNCFYVVADRKLEKGHEYFAYESLFVLSGFSFDNLILCIENGDVLIDFDARTGHNHGTKIRLKQGRWKALFSNVTKEI